MWSVFLNSAHTEFSSEQDCVVFSAHLTADGHSLKQLSAAYFFFCCCSFSILCFIAFLELSSAQSRTVHFKCKTRLAASEVQLHRPPCVPTAVSGKMPAESSATDSVPRPACATALQGTGILKFKHQWPVYTQMFLSSFHRDY